MNNITNIQHYLAHTESLLEHFNRSFEYGKEALNMEKLNRIYDEMIGEEGYIDIFVALYLKTIELHDLGKLSRAFQFQTLNNIRFAEYKTESTEHALTGAFMYVDICIDYINNKIEDMEIRKKFYYPIFLNSYIIRKHHADSLDWFTCSNFQNYLGLWIPHNSRWDRIYTSEFGDYTPASYNNSKVKTIDHVKMYLYNRAKHASLLCKRVDADTTIDYLKLLHKNLREADMKATMDFVDNKIDEEKEILF